MSSAIWTAILQKGEAFSASYEYASRNPEEARETISQRHAGCPVVALILGRHASTHTFNSVGRSGYEYYNDEANQPTGGSD